MANDFYNSSGAPGQGSPGSSAAIRAQFTALASAFDKLPTLTGNGGKFTRINDGGTGMASSSVLSESGSSVLISGSLGVGTTSPSTYGHVAVYNQSGNATAVLALGNSTGGSASLAGALKFFRGSTEKGALAFEAADASVRLASWDAIFGNIQMLTAGVERMRIDPLGNVRITNTAGIPIAVAGAGHIYVEGGALKYRGSSGTITVLAAA